MELAPDIQTERHWWFLLMLESAEAAERALAQALLAGRLRANRGTLTRVLIDLITLQHFRDFAEQVGVLTAAELRRADRFVTAVHSLTYTHVSEVASVFRLQLTEIVSVYRHRVTAAHGALAEMEETEFIDLLVLRDSVEAYCQATRTMHDELIVPASTRRQIHALDETLAVIVSCCDRKFTLLDDRDEREWKHPGNHWWWHGRHR